MKINEALTYWVEICIAGDYSDTLRICKKYCNEVGLCVTVSKTEFVYTQGMESGVIVRLINYPRFPTIDFLSILDKGKLLAYKLIEGLYQGSATIITPYKTYWITTEDYKGKEK